MTERLLQIKKMLFEKKKVNVLELSEYFQVSKVTIRHDLSLLEQEHFARRVHGGAILVPTSDDALRTEEEKEDPILNRIARQACSFIHDGDFILLGPGLTCYTLAAQLKQFSDLCVFTNNLSAVDVLVENHIRVFLMGGEILADRHPLLQTCPSALGISADYMYSLKLFASVSGIDLHAGLTVPYRETADLLSHMQSSARNRFLLADHTKYDQISVYSTGNTQNITHLITDAIPQKYASFFQRIGTQIHIA